MYEKFGKLCMWSWPLPSTRRLYKSNPRDFGKFMASFYYAMIPAIVIESVVAWWLYKRWLKKDDTIDSTLERDEAKLAGTSIEDLQTLTDA